MTITALPSPPSTSDPTTFASKADSLLSALPQFVTEANAQAVAVNSDAANTLAAKEAALAAVNATIWSSGTLYNIGDVRWSPTSFKSYRRKTNGGGTTDPVSDPGNWEQLNGFIGVPDGDKGDIVVSSSGTVFTIDNDAVTFAKMQNIATSKLLGRSTAGSGDVEQLGIGSGLSLSGTDLTALCIGVGQTWQDVTASRALGTTYTNSTGRPILVSFHGGNGSTGNLMTALVNGLAVAKVQVVVGASGYSASLIFIVPNGATYAVNQSGTSGSMSYWAELR